jgi:hypothetical protein
LISSNRQCRINGVSFKERCVSYLTSPSLTILKYGGFQDGGHFEGHQCSSGNGSGGGVWCVMRDLLSCILITLHIFDVPFREPDPLRCATKESTTFRIRGMWQAQAVFEGALPGPGFVIAMNSFPGEFLTEASAAILGLRQAHWVRWGLLSSCQTHG